MTSEKFRFLNCNFFKTFFGQILAPWDHLLVTYVFLIFNLFCINPQRPGGEGAHPVTPKKSLLWLKKRHQRIIFCPKFKFGIFTINLNRIWNLSSIIPHLQAKLKRDLFHENQVLIFPLYNRICAKFPLKSLKMLLLT